MKNRQSSPIVRISIGLPLLVLGAFFAKVAWEIAAQGLSGDTMLSAFIPAVIFSFVLLSAAIFTFFGVKWWSIFGYITSISW